MQTADNRLPALNAFATLYVICCNIDDEIISWTHTGSSLENGRKCMISEPFFFNNSPSARQLYAIMWWRLDESVVSLAMQFASA